MAQHVVVVVESRTSRPHVFNVVQHVVVVDFRTARPHVFNVVLVRRLRQGYSIVTEFTSKSLPTTNQPNVTCLCLCVSHRLRDGIGPFCNHTQTGQHEPQKKNER